MAVYSNNGSMPKEVGKVLSKNDGEMRIREISNGFIVTESWKEMKKGMKDKYKGKNKGMEMAYDDYEYKTKDTYYKENPFK